MLLENRKCFACDKVTAHSNGKCIPCATHKQTVKRKERENMWNGMTTKEKLDYLFKRIGD